METTINHTQQTHTFEEIMNLVYETQRIAREGREEFEQLRKETEQARKETEQARKETEQARKETEQAMKETDRKMRQTDKRINNLYDTFVSQSGHIIEGLMEPSALKLFKEYGFKIDKCWKEMAGRNSVLNKEMEIDLFLRDTIDSIAVEVKIHCTKKKIDTFLEKMHLFKKIFPEFADNTIYVAVAAINYDRDAIQYAKQKGVFVIRVNDDVFSLEPAERSKMLTY